MGLGYNLFMALKKDLYKHLKNIKYIITFAEIQTNYALEVLFLCSQLNLNWCPNRLIKKISNALKNFPIWLIQKKNDDDMCTIKDDILTY